jgi:hypothetical protein
MLIENVFEPGPCHRGVFGVDEDLWDASGPAYRQPCPEVGGGLFPKRKGPFLATLSDDTDARGPLQRELLHLEPHQFGDTQTTGETKIQHGTIPNPEARRQIGSVEDGSHLDHRKMAHQLLIMAFLRDRVDLPDLLQSGWNVECDVPHEGLDRREPGVPGRRGITALLLDVGQVLKHQIGIDVLDAKLRWPLAETFAGENEQQPERVRVSLACMGTVARSRGMCSRRKSVISGAIGVMGCSPRAISASAAMAISVINSGVA